MAKAKTKSTTRRQSDIKRASTSVVIRTAVAYGQAVGAYNGGINVDPDGYAKTALDSGQHFEREACAAIEKLAATPAKHAEELDAKASVAEVILDVHFEGSVLDDPVPAFFRSLASDVREFLKPIISTEQKAKESGIAS